MVVVRAVPMTAIVGLLLSAGCDRARPIATDGTAPCTRCHGGLLGTDGAPPYDLQRRIDGPAVGAHTTHLARGVACSECHLVPTSTTSPGHLSRLDGSPHPNGRAEITFGPRAAAPGFTPSYDPATRACSVYCHGATLGAEGPQAPPRWTDAGPLGCAGCHGAPPATGAHARHATRSPTLAAYGDLRVLEDVDPTNAGQQADYSFGCGLCHPLDPARHLDGTLQVDLSPAGAPAASLRAANRADAVYDPSTRTCSGVSCHSSGQATPAYVASTAWDAGANPAGCFGCHGNPPYYANGGAGTETANGHLGFTNPWGDTSYSWTWGHVRGAHSMPHGGEYDGSGWPGRGSPRSCQTCHFDTVDPANTAPGGFMYLDTTVRTQMQPSRYDPAASQFECQTCHTGAPGAPPAGSGKVLPLRHVNGRREVVFDPRTTVPPGYGSEVGGYTRPVYPYYFIHAFYDFYQDMLPYMTPATVLDQYGGTLTFPLTEARWDPATKSCATVACHYAQAAPGKQVIWGDYLNLPAGGCNACH